MEYVTYNKENRGGHHYYRAFFLFLFVLVLFFPVSGNDTGFRFFKNYGYHDYDHQPQNWQMLQAADGLIYVANHGGILEYDGVSWRLIEIPNYTVRSLAIDPRGTIFVGGTNEIGYLEPDSSGALAYTSLCPLVPRDMKIFSSVWGTYAVGGYIWFDTSEYLFRWDPAKKEMTGIPRNYRTFLVCRHRMFIRTRESGLREITDIETGRLVSHPVPGGAIFSSMSIYAMIPLPDRRILIGSSRNGLFLLDPHREKNRRIEPFPTGADDFLKQNRIIQGAYLVSGDIALATGKGLVIIGSTGDVKLILDKHSGLQDDNVKFIYPDHQHNIWLCLDSGISRIEYHSPLSIHDERTGLPGIALSVVKHNGRLYAGTTRGLYRLEAPLRFRPLPALAHGCWDLVSSRGSLWAATSGGVYRLIGSHTREIYKTLAFDLLPSHDQSGRIWCGTGKGLVLLIPRPDETVEVRPVPSVPHPIRSMAEGTNNRLWLYSTTHGVLSVDTSRNGYGVNYYDKTHGLPRGAVDISFVAGHVIFATEKGLFRFDDRQNRFIPDFTLGKVFAGGPGGTNVFRVVPGPDGSIWFHSMSRNYRAVPGTGNTWAIRFRPFLRLPTSQVNSIYIESDGKTAWFAGIEGLIRYDAAMEKDYRSDFPTHIRRVLVNGRLVFAGGAYTKPVNGTSFPVFPFSRRNFHFEFAAPFYEAEHQTRYRCFLDGYDGDWPPWSKDTKRYYTNLEPGNYTFRVQARNIYNHPGQTGFFQFRVLPPWYRTWWAFVLYGIAAVFTVFFIVKWRLRKIQYEKLKLEHIIKERLKEIKEKNLQLETQSRKLKELDEAKSRFFANISHEFRTPLTLIISPIEEMLAGSPGKKHKKQLQIMLQNSQRVLALINQLLELSRFDSGKAKLNASKQNIVPFLRGIAGSFQVLARQAKLDLVFNAPPEDINLYFDPQKIEEVMYNLLSNAVKFTPPHGTITVSVAADTMEAAGQTGFCKISVQDTGVGIAPDQLGRIFDRFYQAAQPGPKIQKGTGIGLALLKEIVSLHQGKIDVHSSEGKGTEFVVRLPLGTQHIELSSIQSDSLEHPPLKRPDPAFIYSFPESETSGETNGESDDDSHVDDEPKCEISAESQQEKHVILVVEDNADVRHYIRKALESIYIVKEAADGREGVDRALEMIPDLIVSDIMMPKTDGYQLCKRLKNDLHTSHIPIILLTAKASQESIIKGLETGADDYITKPFNTKMLISRIKNLIDLRRQLQLKIQRQKNLLPAEITVSSADEKFLENFQGIIKKNIANPDFDVNILSDKLFMSRSTMFRKVQALTGETPNQFILTYRLETAAQLLKKHFGNVTEIAMAVGFSSPAYFSRCFKEKFHQSPSAFQAAQS